MKINTIVVCEDLIFWYYGILVFWIFVCCVGRKAKPYEMFWNLFWYEYQYHSSVLVIVLLSIIACSFIFSSIIAYFITT
jgi:hypothetical protein